MCGYVFGRRIDERAEIGEWHAVKQFARVVLIERSPRSVLRTHRYRPRNTAIHRVANEVRIAAFDERQHDHRRIIDVGIRVVVELESPPVTAAKGIFDAPITGGVVRNLLLQSPFHGTLHRRMIFAKSRERECAQRPCRVPHRRHARLKAPAFFVVDDEAIETADAFLHHRMIEAEAHKIERNERIHPWRLNAAPASIGFLPLDDPLRSRLHSALTQRVAGDAIVDLQKLIEPPHPARTRNAMHRRFRACVDDLAHVDAKIANGPFRDDDGQRRNRSARPTGEVVEIEWHPCWKVHDLGRQRRNAVPRIYAEEREPNLRENARLY